MKYIDNILQKLENCIGSQTYEPIETEKLEIKDLSNSTDWSELYKSVNAFLNTQGGIVIIGIKEDSKNKQYKFTGFSPNNEPKIKELPKQFTSNEKKEINLSEYIRPETMELRPFLTGHICLIFVEKLPEDQKYVYYKEKAYERQMTGDHLIPPEKILAKHEQRIEIRNAQELQPVPDAVLTDLNVDKLNEYITLLNTGIKVESLKADVESAKPFLSRKKFVRNDTPTLLGMLVCGQHIYDFIGGRCQVDCYVHNKIEIASDKKVYKENIIDLMESCVSFIFNKIGTGISTDKGGSILFEYPERVIRETVNNALAHRDYSNPKFSNITIVPNQYIEIRNPGRFRQEQLVNIQNTIAIRRIVPIPKAQNPNLADILKTYDKWEGKGWGMSTLTNFALDNAIDIPYYRLYTENDIGLFIQKGKVLDEEMELWLKSFSKYILTKTKGRDLSEEEKTVLAYFYKSERLNAIEKYTVNLTPDNNHFAAIKQLEQWGLVTLLPESTPYLHLYSIDRTLTKNEFSEDLQTLFGYNYIFLENEAKQVLEAIYHHNKYSTTQNVSASLIGNYLYAHRKMDMTDINAVNNFKRKIRYIVNQLEKKGLICRLEQKSNYIINENFHKELYG